MEKNIMMKYTGLIIFANWCMLLVAAGSIETPVILMPGITGSPIEAKLDKPSVVDPRCAQKTDDYVLMWLDMNHICPVVCLKDNLRLYYNTTTRRSYNSPGVYTRIPPFANITRLVPTSNGLIDKYYFEKLINTLVEHGYEKSVSLRLAPYDFRKGPHEIAEFWDAYKELIIDTYRKNGNKRVTLMVHSMGAPMTLAFLQMQTQEFKDKYINSMVSLAGAYGGSFKATYVFLEGLVEQSLEEPLDYQKKCRLIEFWTDIRSAIKNKEVQQIARTLPTLYWLFPKTMAWNQSDVLIQTPTKSYSLSNIHELFQDLNQNIEYEMYKDVLPFSNNFTAPGVEVYCVYGYNVSTLSSVEYTSKFPGGKKMEYHGDGDGTVNLNSLQACRQFDGQQKQPFHEMAFPNIDHMEVTTDKTVINALLQVLKVA